MKKKKWIAAAALAAAISLTVIIVVFAGSSKKDGDKIQNVSAATVKVQKASSGKESTKKPLLAENEETGETAEGESDSREEETSKDADNATDAAPAATNTANTAETTAVNQKESGQTGQSVNQTEAATQKTSAAQGQTTTSAAKNQKTANMQPQTQAPTTAPAPAPTQPATQAATQPQTTAHTHNWQAHYATRTVTEAWDEPVYQEYDVWEMHKIHTCSGAHKDGVDLTEAYERYVADHPGATWSEFCLNQAGYVTPCGTDPIFGTIYPGNTYMTQGVIVGTDKIQVNTIHHEAVTEQYIDYYTCSCGATK